MLKILLCITLIITIYLIYYKVFHHRLEEKLLFLRKNGYLLIDKVISNKKCNQILDIVNKELANKNIQAEFIRDSKNRKHIRVIC